MGIHDTVPKGDPNNVPSLVKILKRCILSGTCNANRVVVSAQAHQPGMICTGSGTSLFLDPGLDRNMLRHSPKSWIENREFAISNSTHSVC